MKTSYGTMPATAPAGMSRPIHFPSMASMDKRTGDGRKLLSEGKGVRDLPRTIYAQFVNTMGHENAVIVGALHGVEFHDDGNVEGWGWLLDDENGSKMAYYLESQAFRHNSIDLAEAKVHIDIEEDDEGDLSLVIDFTEWKIAATTFVGKPAFADAYGELADETKASFLDPTTPLEWTGEYVIREIVATETTASLAVDDPTAVAIDDFLVAEAETPHKIIVGPRREDGRCEVYGHLASWNDPGPRKPPRPLDNYASFNQPSVLLTDGTLAETGPIFFQGGHPDLPLGKKDPASAYGGVENAWADVRVVQGIHGPWLSGLTRPGVSDEVIYAARASRISGHWVGSELRAIVSVNVPRFNIVGSGLATGAISWSTDEEGHTLELVASWTSDDEPMQELSAPLEIDYEAVAERVVEILSQREAAEDEQRERIALELALLDD
jgi:hypothetical protein